MERPWLMLGRVLVIDMAVYAHAAAQAAQAQAQHPAVAEADEDGVIDAHVYDEQRAEAAANVVAAAAAVDAHAPMVVEAAKDAEQQQQQAAAAALEESVVATNTSVAESVAAHAARGGAAAPDFTVVVEAPPRLAAIIAGPSSHPDPRGPDMYPYVVATGPFCLLVHFAVAPSYGTVFDDWPEPGHSHLVVARHFRRRAQDADGGHVVEACAVRVPDRPNPDDFPRLFFIEGVGLICDQATGHYKIAELILATGAPQAQVVFMSSDTGLWDTTFHANPLLRENAFRNWVPHGTVTVDSSTVVWFDLSWGIISCDLAQPLHQRSLVYHRLPHGCILLECPPDLHCKRCVAVSQHMVRFVEIDLNPPRPAMAMVKMWNRDLQGERRWNANYSVKLEEIWSDESYHRTGLPRTVPVLAGVSPVNSSVVYFTLEHRLFGVDVPHHRVVQCERHDPLIASPGPPDEAVTSRYLITWDLDADQEPNAGYEDDQLSDHADSSGSGPADEGEIDYMTYYDFVQMSAYRGGSQ